MGTESVERALVFADPSGVVLTWSDGAEVLFGHAAEDAIGQTLDLVVPPDYRERHWAGYRAAMEARDGDIDHGSFNVPGVAPGRNGDPDRGQAARGSRQPQPRDGRDGRVLAGRRQRAAADAPPGPT